jgi:murein DD-endopeptidase MepM/ murein hydrolase activator NlpD
VTRGQVIGFVGNSGLCRGAHLHYSVIFKGGRIDPVCRETDSKSGRAGIEAPFVFKDRKELSK